MDFIETQPQRLEPQFVGRVQAGEVVEFLDSFHQDNCPPHARFLVAHGLRLDGYRHHVCVVNLRSGRISYVAKTRRVNIFRGSVHLEARP